MKDDLISRQAAIDEAYEIIIDGQKFEVVQVETLMGLPSAQPQACDDAISREDAKWVVFCNRDHVEDQANAIDSLPCVQPSAQPHRIKGRWIYGEHDVAMCDGYRCDKCGFFVPWDYKYTFIDFINDYHFCPNCGSDMRGEDNESSR